MENEKLVRLSPELVEAGEHLAHRLRQFAERLEHFGHPTGGEAEEAASSLGPSQDQVEGNQTIILHVSRKDSLEISDNDLAALKNCARAKGFVVKDVVKDAG